MANALITVRLKDGSRIIRKPIRFFADGRKAELRHNNTVIVAYMVSWFMSGYVWIDEELYTDYLRNGDPELNAALSEQEKALAAQGQALAAQEPANPLVYEKFDAVPFMDERAAMLLGLPYRNAQGETISGAHDRQMQVYLKQRGDFNVWYTYYAGVDGREELKACITILDAPNGEAAREAFNQFTNTPSWQALKLHNVAVFPGRDEKQAKLFIPYTAIAAQGENEAPAQGEEIAAQPAQEPASVFTIKLISAAVMVKAIPDNERLHARFVARANLGAWFPIEHLGRLVKVNRVVVVAPSGEVIEELTTKPEEPRPMFTTPQERDAQVHAANAQVAQLARYDKGYAYASAAHATSTRGILCDACGDYMPLGGFYYKGLIYCASCAPDDAVAAFLASKGRAQESEAE